MNLLDLTLATPAENLACDEALLDRCDAGKETEVLRFWESTHHFVVAGYSNQVEREVNVQACRELKIPILRRCSGGGTIVQGPGCVNYALIMRIDSNPELKTITSTNGFIMERNRVTIESLLNNTNRSDIRDPASGIEHRASSIQHPSSSTSIRCHTDLAIGDRKFSGNAQRRRQRAVLFHGSLLLNFDFDLVSELLPLPSKQPDYRHNRSHGEFLINLGLKTSELKSALASAWNAGNGLEDVPFDAIRGLVAGKYSRIDWNLRH